MSKADFEKMDWKEYREYLKKESQSRRIPQSATFELTPLCNFNCRMCYVHLQPEQMESIGSMRTAEEWVSLAEKMKEEGVLYILLTGGEVFTRKDFLQIYEPLSEMGFLVSIYTNGYLLTDELIDWLAERPPLRLRITMYGMSDETYEAVCGVRDGFSRVQENIEKLRAKGLPLGLAMTIIEQNEKDFEKCREYAGELDVPFEFSSNIVKPVRGAESDAEQVRIRKCPAAADSAESERAETDSRGPFPETEDPFARCGSRNRSIWITWNGKMSACAFISSIQTDPFAGSFKEAWKELWGRMDRIRKPKKCLSCDLQTFCSACPGEREAETGSMEGVAELFCERARRFQTIYLSSSCYKEE